MKLTRLLTVLLAFVLITGALQAQTPTENKTKLGAYPIWSFTNIDSAVSQTALAYDCSLIKANTLYYSFLFDGATDDSLQIIVMGRLTNASTETIKDVAIDTVYAKADLKYIVAASFTGGVYDWLYIKIMPWNNPTGEGNNGDLTDNATLRVGFIGTTNANINIKRSWWDNY